MYDPFESQVRGSCCWVFLFWLAKTRLNYHMELRWSCICVYVGVVYIYVGVLYIYMLELYMYKLELYMYADFEFELEGSGIVG